MKYLRLLMAVTILSTICLFAFTDRVTVEEVKSTSAAKGITWYQMEDLESLQQKQPRKVIVDVYTDWCKWCKVMDEKTFTDQSLSAYLAEHYYMVKLNAEQKQAISFKGKTYGYKQGGRRGYNELAAALCEGSLSYPSFVVLDTQLEVLNITRGYKEAAQFKAYLESI